MRLKYGLARPERSDPMPAPLTGGCLCGAAGTVNAVVPSASFRITKGATRKYDDSATHSGRTLSRHFCADCGSPIYSQRNPDPGFLVVRAGTLDDSSGMKIAGNIWTASARPWAYIDRSTECHPGNMPPPPPKA